MQNYVTMVTLEEKIGQQSIFYRQGMIKMMEYIVSITYFLTTTISYFKLKLSVIIQSGDSNFKKIMQCPFHCTQKND